MHDTSKKAKILVKKLHTPKRGMIRKLKELASNNAATSPKHRFWLK